MDLQDKMAVLAILTKCLINKNVLHLDNFAYLMLVYAFMRWLPFTASGKWEVVYVLFFSKSKFSKWLRTWKVSRVDKYFDMSFPYFVVSGTTSKVW